jgi:hypothetical protein
MDLRFPFRKFRLSYERCLSALCRLIQKAVRKIMITILFYRFFQFQGMLRGEEHTAYLTL